MKRTFTIATSLLPLLGFVLASASAQAQPEYLSVSCIEPQVLEATDELQRLRLAATSASVTFTRDSASQQVWFARYRLPKRPGSGALEGGFARLEFEGDVVSFRIWRGLSGSIIADGIAYNSIESGKNALAKFRFGKTQTEIELSCAFERTPRPAPLCEACAADLDFSDSPLD